jgi:hypothetical protein
MLARFRPRLSYANVVATMALFLALGGGAYAAATLPKNSVGSKQIKKNAVTSKKVKDGSLKATDFGTGQIPPGAKGDKGDKGNTGPAGSAVAYAHVDGTGAFNPAQSKNVTATSHVNAITGYYCINVAVPVKNISATVDSLGPSNSISARFGDATGECPTGTDAVVETGAGGAADNRGFFITFN